MTERDDIARRKAELLARRKELEVALSPIKGRLATVAEQLINLNRLKYNLGIEIKPIELEILDIDGELGKIEQQARRNVQVVDLQRQLSLRVEKMEGSGSQLVAAFADIMERLVADPVFRSHLPDIVEPGIASMGDRRNASRISVGNEDDSCCLMLGQDGNFLIIYHSKPATEVMFHDLVTREEIIEYQDIFGHYRGPLRPLGILIDTNQEILNAQPVLFWEKVFDDDTSDTRILPIKPPEDKWSAVSNYLYGLLQTGNIVLPKQLQRERYEIERGK